MLDGHMSFTWRSGNEPSELGGLDVARQALEQADSGPVTRAK